MKNRIRNGVLPTLLLLGLVLFGFNNCSKVEFNDDLAQKAFRSGETVVGNPMTAAAKAVLAKVCTLVVGCHPEASASACESEFMKISAVDYQMGLTQNSFKTFWDIIQSESAGQLAANATATNTCLNEIENLKCSDESVQNVYDSAAGTFKGLSNLIPTGPGSCPAIFSQPPALQEYFVATNGDDSNDGSMAHPWATLTHASQALTLGAQGTTVHVGPGTYSVATISKCSSNSESCGVKTTRHGSSSAPITYISDQAGAAKIIAPGASAIWYNSGDYVRIIGFEIEGSSTANFGIFSEAAFGKMIGNHIHGIPVTKGCAINSSGGGIFFGYLDNAHDNDALGNRIHDIGPPLTNGLPQTSYCHGMANGISYDQPRGQVQNNIIYNVHSWGLATWHKVSSLQVSHNLIFHNGNIAGDGTPLGGAIFISAESGVGVHNNTTISNNIIRNNAKGLNEFGPVGNTNAYLNNLMFSNARDFDLVSGVTPQRSLTADPQMVNFQLSGGGDYRLKVGSPAIDAGTYQCASPLPSGSCTPGNDFSGYQRPIGSALDIGPYEWHP